MTRDLQSLSFNLDLLYYQCLPVGPGKSRGCFLTLIEGRVCSLVNMQVILGSHVFCPSYAVSLHINSKRDRVDHLPSDPHPTPHFVSFLLVPKASLSSCREGGLVKEVKSTHNGTKLLRAEGFICQSFPEKN